MEKLTTILILFLSIKLYSQDSIKVKIKSIKKEKVVMKTLERPRVKYETKCSCPYRRKQIIWIKKPELSLKF